MLASSHQCQIRAKMASVVNGGQYYKQEQINPDRDVKCLILQVRTQFDIRCPKLLELKKLLEHNDE